MADGQAKQSAAPEERLVAALEALAARDRLLAQTNRQLWVLAGAEDRLSAARADNRALTAELEKLRLARRVEAAECEARVAHLEEAISRLAAPPPPPPPDDLTRIKGIGPVIEGVLHGFGITTFHRLATLSPEDTRGLGDLLGPFPGRMERDRWREQAAELARGHEPGAESAPAAGG